VAEVYFYHLERSPLERALPDLLSRSLERGWRVVVKFGSDERLAALNAHLWTFDDASFLPHGSAADGNAEEQPIFLTTGDDNPNNANVCFLVDGAGASDFSAFIRTVFMFDAADTEAAARARESWKAVTAAGHEVAYWRQDEHGRWTRS
jgi:DNA polymerase-3 subunit chi